ncbi:MAG: hypothetical protein NC204_05450 [Candidatus Amulumruptor caecigallinarius]|nr:hypothetical protein [Candidatus Amulumruptor caecigallinarius]
MINTGIIGAGSRDAGELIRLLAMHPEIDIKTAYEKGLEGKPLPSHHHGLIGETDLSFSTTVDLRGLDVLFICDNNIGAEQLKVLADTHPELKTIYMAYRPGIDEESNGMVYGLPEINRKALVRGAVRACVPSSFASMALVALYPLALHLLLQDDITLNISAPEPLILKYDLKIVSEEISRQLRKVQQSFNSDIKISATPSASRRSAVMQIDFKCGVSREQLEKLYEMYDDHNFAFLVQNPPGVSEVAGTNRCILSVSSPEENRIAISVAADCRLRGAAGEAVHIMNLMFGLHEKTGLSLKAIDFDPI